MLFTFYIQGVLKLKKKIIPALKVNNKQSVMPNNRLGLLRAHEIQPQQSWQETFWKGRKTNVTVRVYSGVTLIDAFATNISKL